MIWCFISCLLNYTALLLGWLLLIVTFLKVAFGLPWYNTMKQKIFAWFMDTYDKHMFKIATDNAKKNLFSSIKDIKSSDPELRKKNALNILEIGVGTGCNLEYYPAGSKLLCIDPNPEFASYFRQECEAKAAHLDPDIRVVNCWGEDMRDVADDSVDAVVATYVLCSVEEVGRMMREIKRVLAPGGVFFYLDHTAAKKGSWRRFVHDSLTNSELWQTIFEGCQMNIDPRPALNAAGFSSVDSNEVNFWDDGRVTPAESGPHPGYLAIYNPFQYGTATK